MLISKISEQSCLLDFCCYDAASITVLLIRTTNIFYTTFHQPSSSFERNLTESLCHVTDFNHYKILSEAMLFVKSENVIFVFFAKFVLTFCKNTKFPFSAKSKFYFTFEKKFRFNFLRLVLLARKIVDKMFYIQPFLITLINISHAAQI